MGWFSDTRRLRRDPKERNFGTKPQQSTSYGWDCRSWRRAGNSLLPHFSPPLKSREPRSHERFPRRPSAATQHFLHPGLTERPHRALVCYSGTLWVQMGWMHAAHSGHVAARCPLSVLSSAFVSVLPAVLPPPASLRESPPLCSPHFASARSEQLGKRGNKRQKKNIKIK